MQGDTTAVSETGKIMTTRGARLRNLHHHLESWNQQPAASHFIVIRLWTHRHCLEDGTTAPTNHENPFFHCGHRYSAPGERVCNVVAGLVDGRPAIEIADVSEWGSRAVGGET